MSRVEAKKSEVERESQQRRYQQERVDRTPGKAEGDENTIDEALRNQRSERERDRR